MERDMPNLYFRDLKVLALCCLIVGGCGSKPTEGSTQAESPTPAAAKKADDGSSDSRDSSAGGSGTWTCLNYAAGGVDYQSQSAAYLFIGDHPMCAEKGKVEQFCKSLTTRDGYNLAEEGNVAAEGAPEIAQSLPEESRDAFMQQHPKHSFDQAMAKCGLKVDQVRAQLVAETDASIKAGSKATQDADVAFLIREAPSTAEAIWTRECAGRISQITRGEGLDWDFKGNPNYKFFCNRTSAADNSSSPVKFNRKLVN
jgi:hypothetical protein